MRTSTPRRSLTGPVGQLFVFHPGGQRFASWGYMYPHLQWNRVHLLAMSHFIGDPDVIDHDALPRPRARQQQEGSLGRHADNVKNPT
jgi:hypothetical protein